MPLASCGKRLAAAFLPLTACGTWGCWLRFASDTQSNAADRWWKSAMWVLGRDWLPATAMRLWAGAAGSRRWCGGTVSVLFFFFVLRLVMWRRGVASWLAALHFSP